MGYIDDSPSLTGKRLGGVMIYSEEQAFTKVLKAEGINEIVFAVNDKNITKARKKELFDRCMDNNIHIRQVPPVKEWIDGQFSVQQISYNFV